MHAGIPIPNDTPSKRTTKPINGTDDVLIARNAMGEIMPKAIQATRNSLWLILLVNEAPTNAETPIAEK
jgi:hypothetical protein